MTDNEMSDEERAAYVARREVHWPERRVTARRIYWTHTFKTNAEQVRLLFTGDGLVYHLDADGIVLIPKPIPASMLFGAGFERADKGGVLNVTTSKNVALVVSLLRVDD
jgi:hypothetical protein